MDIQTKINDRKIAAFDLLRKLGLATKKAKEWQTELNQLENEVNQLEQQMQTEQITNMP